MHSATFCLCYPLFSFLLTIHPSIPLSPLFFSTRKKGRRKFSWESFFLYLHSLHILSYYYPLLTLISFSPFFVETMNSIVTLSFKRTRRNFTEDSKLDIYTVWSKFRTLDWYTVEPPYPRFTAARKY